MVDWFIAQASDGRPCGVWPGVTEAEAIVEMLRDAGYGPRLVWVSEDAETVCFASPALEAACGGPDAWTVLPVSRGHRWP